MRSNTLYVTNVPVAAILLADSFSKRLRGMLFRRPLPPAMLITPTNAVHGFGMTKKLDVAFLDERGTVLKIATLFPFGFAACSKAVCAIEAPHGSFSTWDLTVGSTTSIN